MTKLLSYTDKGTWIHRLSGSTKLIFFLLWCVTSAMTYEAVGQHQADLFPALVRDKRDDV